MSETLASFVTAELHSQVPAEVEAVARKLREQLGGVAVLFYGSVLRTRALGDLLDFYVLTDFPPDDLQTRRWPGWLWPDVSYHEIDMGDRLIRAKVATMPLRIFERAVTGATMDTTIWIRFAQPCALICASDPVYEARVERSIGQAIATAARFAAALGPGSGLAEDYWAALLRETYRAELRVEPPGRERHILSHAPERYERLLPLAWQADTIPFSRSGATLSPAMDRARRAALIKAWRKRAACGKLLNAARLVKAAFTFDGAARYALWKIERHTGVHLELTPWRERHPVLAAPAVLWRVFRAGGR